MAFTLLLFLPTITQFAMAQTPVAIYTSVTGSSTSQISFEQDADGDVIVTADALVPPRPMHCRDTQGNFDGYFYNGFFHGWSQANQVNSRFNQGYNQQTLGLHNNGADLVEPPHSKTLIPITKEVFYLDNPQLVIMYKPGTTALINVDIHYTSHPGVLNAVSLNQSFQYNFVSDNEVIMVYDIDTALLRVHDYFILKYTVISGTVPPVLMWINGDVPGTQANIGINTVYHTTQEKYLFNTNTANTYPKTSVGDISFMDMQSIYIGWYGGSDRIGYYVERDAPDPATYLYDLFNSAYLYYTTPISPIFYNTTKTISSDISYAFNRIGNPHASQVIAMSVAQYIYSNSRISGELGIAYTTATPMYDLSESTTSLNPNQILIPGYMLQDAGHTSAGYVITCAIENPYNSNGQLHRTLQIHNGHAFTFTYQPRTDTTFQLPLVPMVTGQFTANDGVLTGLGTPIIYSGQGHVTIPGSLVSDNAIPVNELPFYSAVDFPEPLVVQSLVSVVRTGSLLTVSVVPESEVPQAANLELSECTFKSKFLLQYLEVNNTSGVFNSTVDESDIILVSCSGLYGSEVYTHNSTSLAFNSQYVSLIKSLDANEFGWGGQDAFGLGIIASLAFFSAMAGFQRYSLPASLVIFISVIATFVFFGILELDEAIFASILVLVILGIFQRGHR